MEPAAWRDLTIRLDPWSPDFGVEAPGFAEAVDEPEARVALDVEVPADRWAPIAAGDAPLPARLRFVDGVRRVDARIVGRRGDRRFLGAFGSWAVGAVAVERGEATFAEARVGRTFALGAGEALDQDVVVSDTLRYAPVSTADDTPDGPVRVVHGEMRRAEEDLARALADDPDTLVVCDGPVTFEHAVRGAAVGIVKRIQRLYLPASHFGVLVALAPGERTPLFATEGDRFARYAWFLRLAAPRCGDAETSGLVRLEVAQTVGAERARALAEATAGWIPSFAGIRGLHARAPQNLLPIAALEGALRRRMGDARLVHRQIHDHVTREAA